MPLLYLIRHPLTRVDLGQPVHTWTLAGEGRAQLAKLLDAPLWPQVAAIYPSAEHKAILPAEQVGARYEIPVHPTPAFNELGRRAYTAPDTAAYQANIAQMFAQPGESARGWETAEAALARFRAGMDAVLAQHGESDSIAVITHGLVITLYMAHLRGEPVSLAWWQALGFCTTAAIDRAALRPLTDFLAAPYDGLPLPKDSHP